MAITIALSTMSSLFADANSTSNTRNQTSLQNSRPSDPYYYDQDTNEFFVYAEWIYWKPVTDDPMYWSRKQHTATSTSPNTIDINADARCIKFDFSSGFRAGGGYRFARNRMGNDVRPWQFETEYTRLHTAESGHAKARGRIRNSGGNNIQEVITAETPDLGSTDYIFGHSRVSLEYDRLDVKFAWPIWMRSNVMMRLMTGATFAWFENSWHNWFSSVPQFSNQRDRTKFDWKWWGGGLMGGGDIYLAIGKGFGFFADSSFGLLFGPMKQKESYFLSTDVLVHETFNSKYRPYKFQPVVNFGAGVDYKHWFKKSVMLHMALGWEFTWWFDMNQFGKLVDRNGTQPSIPDLFFNKASDLGFQGLTARLGFDF